MNVRKWIIPQSKLGKASLLAVLSFIVFFILSQVVVIPTGPKESPSFFNDPLTATFLIIAGLSGVFAFCSGTVSLIKSKERAIPVLLATFVGLFILIFWLGEVLSEH